MELKMEDDGSFKIIHRQDTPLHKKKLIVARRNGKYEFQYHHPEWNKEHEIWHGVATTATLYEWQVRKLIDDLLETLK